jgi:hypothetical protein
MKNLILQTALTLKELGDLNAPVTFDELVKGVIGADDLNFDSIDKDAYEEVENNILLFLDSIGANEKVINEFLSKDDEESAIIGATIAKSIANQYDDVTILNVVDEFKPLNEAKIQFDSVMPERKAGYTRKLVIRDGKKVWINKRNPNKKVILSPKQKLALMKARIKAHTGLAKARREKSMKKRATFKLK